MQRGDGSAVPDGAGEEDPRATSRHVERLEFVLRGAVDLDELTRLSLVHLVTLPGVTRAGLALTEGLGRRLRFVASDRGEEGELSWSHIDAYDDVPLTAVARTGAAVIAGLDDLDGRYAEFVAHRRGLGDRALVALPLPGGGTSVLGAIILYFDRDRAFPPEERRAYETAARRIAEAVRRVRSATQSPGHDPAALDVDGLHRASLGLEADPRAAGAARRFLRERLTAWEVDDTIIETAQLCVSELVNNVIMHARTSSRLTVSLEQRQVTVMLRDLGGAAATGVPHQHHPVQDPDQFRVFGRGLTLVDALADDWGSHRDHIGTSAWFVCRLPAVDDDQPARTG